MHYTYIEKYDIWILKYDGLTNLPSIIIHELRMFNTSQIFWVLYMSLYFLSKKHLINIIETIITKLQWIPKI